MNGRDEILTAQEVADILKVSRRMVYTLHERGLLIPSHQLPAASGSGRKSREGWRWTLRDIDQFLARSVYRPKVIRLPGAGLREFVPVSVPSRKNHERNAIVLDKRDVAAVSLPPHSARAEAS